MSALLLWAWLFTLPGLLLTALGVGKRPGAASQGGPPLMLIVALAALATGAHAEFEIAELAAVPAGRRLPPARRPALGRDAGGDRGRLDLRLRLLARATWTARRSSGAANVRRFFCFLDFFLASMALLVLAGNIAVLLIGWTGVGISSFLLISLLEREGRARSAAGLQALAANAIGDARAAGGAGARAGRLRRPDSRSDRPQLRGRPGGATLLAWLILIAAAAKSAQGPLYFWLPSAMAGPTPVSALIHAATMVAAGVYLLARTHALLDAAPERRAGDRRHRRADGARRRRRSACSSRTSSAAWPTPRSASLATCSPASASGRRSRRCSTWSPTPRSRRCCS